ncbi:hypothetical protein ETAA8_57300 [Anatilimnocola aggregata]|uniref:Uncharacterized protein n=2 Tax=Anatilimnocola aggregata TaxID=2528021 RepID=A0A517YK37_9BACT|nr:hypothetical protein ETAA8_57300 [Anatilimnocola aggregata]
MTQTNVDSDSQRLRALGLAAIAFFLIHALYQQLHGRLENLLWACHLADLAVGLGLVLASRAITATGLVMLGFGVPMWLVGLATGGEFYPTSILTHLGGTTVGILGLRRLGGLQGDWWKAYLAILLLIVLSRCLTPAAMNVNFAFRTWGFAREWIPSLEIHLLSLLAVWAAGLFAAESVLRLLVRHNRQLANCA